MPQVRNTQIDSLKFFMIFLVFVGHCLDIGLTSHYNNALFRFIYSFHMPVFVILSGIVFRTKNQKDLLTGGVILGSSYLIFQLLYGGKVLAYSGGSIVNFWIHGFFYNLTHLYDPADGLWYLVSLFLWRLFLNSSDRMFQNKVVLHLGLALMISLFAGFVPIGRVMSFQRTFAFYPLFVLGYYLKDYYAILRNIPKIIPLGVIVVYVVIVLLNDVPPIRVLLQRNPYDISHLLSSISGRVFCYVWGVPISLSVIAVFPDFKYFAQEGSRTLFYYMYHMFFVLLFRYLVINTSLECNILSVFTYAAVSFFVMKQMRKVPLFTFLTNIHVTNRKS